MTISDTLVSLFILILISALVIGIFFAFYNIYKQQLVQKELNNDNLISLNVLTSAIKNSAKVVDTKNIHGTTYTTDSDTLILELPSIDANNNIIGSKYDYQVFYRNPGNTNLFMSDILPDASSSRTSSSAVISTNTSKLVFHYNNTAVTQASKVQVVYVSEKTASNKIFQVISQTTDALRNY